MWWPFKNTIAQYRKELAEEHEKRVAPYRAHADEIEQDWFLLQGQYFMDEISDTEFLHAKNQLQKQVDNLHLSLDANYRRRKLHGEG